MFLAHQGGIEELVGYLPMDLASLYNSPRM